MPEKIQGFVAEGFEPVQKHFEKMLSSGCEDNMQLCVYLGKTCVVDLYGSYKENSPYDGDSMQVSNILIRVDSKMPK